MVLENGKHPQEVSILYGLPYLLWLMLTCLVQTHYIGVCMQCVVPKLSPAYYKHSHTYIAIVLHAATM